jgi:hypothetical protein
MRIRGYGRRIFALVDRDPVGDPAIADAVAGCVRRQQQHYH